MHFTFYEIFRKQKRKSKKSKEGKARDVIVGSDDEMEDDVARLSVTQPAASTSSQSTSAPQAGGERSAFWPCARMNAQMVVVRGVLYLYGGLYEEANKQVTLQDMYALDLSKLDQWRTLIPNRAEQMVSRPAPAMTS